MPFREDEVDASVALAWLVQAMGRRSARRLIDQEATVHSAVAKAGATPEALAQFGAMLLRGGSRIMSAHHPRFPAQLGQIPDPPLVLYLSGNPEVLSRRAVAIVGARRCSRGGAEIAARFAAELAALGVNVISGLARGIDAAAHRGALTRGPTTAVLGAGLTSIYTPSQRQLGRQILDAGGLLIRGIFADQQARKFQFPERNRLISGLSLGVLVVEAGERSGSLITARFALEQGREVMAVPGSIANPLTRGCHQLLRDGAALVESVSDVMETLGLAGELRMAGDSSRPDPAQPEEPELARLLALLEYEITSFDALCECAGEPPELIAARLLELELRGFVEQVPGGYIRRAVMAHHRRT